MARRVLLFVLCVLLPALMVSASRPARSPFVVKGRVYCDTCRAGFETSATTFIAGARPQHDCATVSPGRERTRVILTRYNGIASDNRFANAMGFMKDKALSGCAEILKQYQESDE
ncbi:hypothetical protein SLA2020_368030 [Shorea laevis]